MERGQRARMWCWAPARACAPAQAPLRRRDAIASPCEEAGGFCRACSPKSANLLTLKWAHELFPPSARDDGPGSRPRVDKASTDTQRLVVSRTRAWARHAGAPDHRRWCSTRRAWESAAGRRLLRSDVQTQEDAERRSFATGVWRRCPPRFRAGFLSPAAAPLPPSPARSSSHRPLLV